MGTVVVLGVGPHPDYDKGSLLPVLGRSNTAYRESTGVGHTKISSAE